MLWIALHLPRLSLETFAATRLADPAVADPPLALLQAHRIADVNAAAAARGVQPGMKRATALALAPDLGLGQTCLKRDAQALASVADVALAFTPMVLLDAPEAAARAAAAQGVLLEVQASLRFFGGHAALCRRLQQALQPLGHQVQMACAPTPLGASVLARWREGLAAGPHVGDRAALQALLDDAPVWLLGPGREHWEALQGMGLETLGHLRRLPRSGLARRFGPPLLQALDRARGDLPDPRQPLQPAPQFDRRLDLQARADHHDQPWHAVQSLLAALVAWVRTSQRRVLRFELHLHHERPRRAEPGPPPTVLALEPAQPSADPDHLLSLLRERWARQAWPAPVLALSLHCRDTQAGAAPSGELFPTREQAQQGLVRLVERLQARLGEQGVQGLRLQADHRPELASILAPTRPAAWATTTAATVPARTPGSPLTRPVWRLEPPQPLATQPRGGPLLQGRPLRLLAGPERIETGWWDGPPTARDYFIAEADDGCLLWLYRLRQPGPDTSSAEGDGWFLHGHFA